MPFGRHRQLQPTNPNPDMSQTQFSRWRRIREIWAELDDAQRRLLEIRTGVPLTARSIRAAEIADLEIAFALSHPGPTRPTAAAPRKPA